MADDDKQTKAYEKFQKAEEAQQAIAVDNKMYDTPQIAPDGHVNLSKEDIANRA